MKNTVFIGLVCVVQYIMSRTAQQLVGIYDERSAELPLLTQFLLPDSIYYWILPVLLIILAVLQYLGTISQRLNKRLAQVATFGSAVIYIFGLYLMVIDMGRVIT